MREVVCSLSVLGIRPSGPQYHYPTPPILTIPSVSYLLWGQSLSRYLCTSFIPYFYVNDTKLGVSLPFFSEFWREELRPLLLSLGLLGGVSHPTPCSNNTLVRVLLKLSICYPFFGVVGGYLAPIPYTLLHQQTIKGYWGYWGVSRTLHPAPTTPY